MLLAPLRPEGVALRFACALGPLGLMSTLSGIRSMCSSVTRGLPRVTQVLRHRDPPDHRRREALALLVLADRGLGRLRFDLAAWPAMARVLEEQAAYPAATIATGGGDDSRLNGFHAT